MPPVKAVVLCKDCDMFHELDRRKCPCNCSKCGGELDVEGWCAKYCTADEEPKAGV